MTNKTNPELIELGKALHKTSRETQAPIWFALSKALKKPRKNMTEINVGRLARYTKEGETVAVPGKVLGIGTIQHKITVAAIDFSKEAKDKILNAGGHCLTIGDLIKTNPKGTKIKLMR
jgi:large subunit ribosomal protein L18e